MDWAKLLKKCLTEPLPKRKNTGKFKFEIKNNPEEDKAIAEELLRIIRENEGKM